MLYQYYLSKERNCRTFWLYSRVALYLEKTVKEQITKDGVIGIGISVTAVVLIAGGIITALASRKS
ncbi:unnamed protein product [Coffea canephora]|uniref:Uncharacterized protein n=1 Tax=Coffea canephora TaxID=49390 RepID=A0A068UU22_COFCA|nr:unnamed protein product [Coffea canephora]